MVTTLYSTIKTGFFDKIANVLGSNVNKKILHWTSSKMCVTRASQCRTFNQKVLDWVDNDKPSTLVDQCPKTLSRKRCAVYITFSKPNVHLAYVTKKLNLRDSFRKSRPTCHDCIKAEKLTTAWNHNLQKLQYKRVLCDTSRACALVHLLSHLLTCNKK